MVALLIVFNLAWGICQTTESNRSMDMYVFEFMCRRILSSIWFVPPKFVNHGVLFCYENYLRAL